MKLRPFLLSSLLLLNQPAFAEEPRCQEILDYSQHHFSPYGILKNSQGFLYVDVDDNYIHELIHWVEGEGFIEPPYFGAPHLVGAHITVLSAEETKLYGIEKVEECGQTIHFSIKDCQIVTPPKWKEVEAVYVLTVEAPELDTLREKYGLPPKTYEFHITIGIKLKEAS